MQQKGFTLIELLVVIAILGVAAAMAGASFKRTAAQTRTLNTSAAIEQAFAFAKANALKESVPVGLCALDNRNPKRPTCQNIEVNTNFCPKESGGNSAKCFNWSQGILIYVKRNEATPDTRTYVPDYINGDEIADTGDKPLKVFPFESAVVVTNNVAASLYFKPGGYSLSDRSSFVVVPSESDDKNLDHVTIMKKLLRRITTTNDGFISEKI